MAMNYCEAMKKVLKSADAKHNEYWYAATYTFDYIRIPRKLGLSQKESIPPAKKKTKKKLPTK